MLSTLKGHVASVALVLKGYGYIVERLSDVELSIGLKLRYKPSMIHEVASAESTATLLTVSFKEADIQNAPSDLALQIDREIKRLLSKSLEQDESGMSVLLDRDDKDLVVADGQIYVTPTVAAFIKRAHIEAVSHNLLNAQRRQPGS